MSCPGAQGGKIRLTATDLDVEVVESSSADIAREGATTVPGHMLHDIVRKLPDGAQVEIVQGPDDKRRLAPFPAGRASPCSRCRPRISPI